MYWAKVLFVSYGSIILLLLTLLGIMLLTT